MKVKKPVLVIGIAIIAAVTIVIVIMNAINTKSVVGKWENKDEFQKATFNLKDDNKFELTLVSNDSSGEQAFQGYYYLMENDVILFLEDAITEDERYDFERNNMEPQSMIAYGYFNDNTLIIDEGAGITVFRRLRW